MEMEEDQIVTLDISGQLINCNKDVLVKGSDYFRAMFDSNMIETQTNEVKLKDQEFAIMKSLIDCLTSGELKINDNIEELTAASVRFQMKSVTDICMSYLQKTLSDETCLGMSIFAASLNLSHLHKLAKRHALYYFNKVVKCEEFLTLNLDEVIDILSDKRLHCETELDILSAIERWIRHDFEDRVIFLSDLMTCFHAEDLEKDERNKLENWSILNETEVGKEWLQKLQEQTIMEFSVSKKYREMPVTILSVGERIRQNGHLHIDIWKLSESENTLKPFQQFHCNPIGYRVLVIDKDFYLTGGQTSITRSVFMKDVWKFDGFDQTWTKVTQLPEPRRHHGACASRTSIFLLGGFGKFREVLDTVQEYNVDNDEWRCLPSMKSKGYSLQVEYCNNKLYLCREENIEYLDLHTLCWSHIPLSGFTGNDASSILVLPVAYKNYIYLFKYNQFYHVMSVEGLFDEVWTHGKEWTRLDTDTHEFSTHPCHTDLNFGHKLTAYEGKLYMLNYGTNDIVVTQLNNLQTFMKLGTSGKEDDHCNLVILPNYPV